MWEATQLQINSILQLEHVSLWISIWSSYLKLFCLTEMAPFSETSNHTNLITPHWNYILNKCKSNSIQIWWKSIQLFFPTTVTSQQKLPLDICLAAVSHHWDLLKCHLRETHPQTTQYKFTHHHLMSVLTSYSVYHHLRVCVIQLFSLNQSSRKGLCWQTVTFWHTVTVLNKWIILHSFEELCDVLKLRSKASLGAQW